MTKKQIKQLESAGRKLEKCGGDCRHCSKCHIYTRWTERAGYMAVGCDLLPSELCPTFVVKPLLSLTHVSPRTLPRVKLKL